MCQDLEYSQGGGDTEWTDSVSQRIWPPSCACTPRPDDEEGKHCESKMSCPRTQRSALARAQTWTVRSGVQLITIRPLRLPLLCKVTLIYRNVLALICSLLLTLWFIAGCCPSPHLILLKITATVTYWNPINVDRESVRHTWFKKQRKQSTRRLISIKY